MNTPKDKHPSKSSFSDTSDDLEGAEKQIKLSGYLKPENEASKIQLNDNKDTICSDTWISFQAVEDSPWQPSDLGEYRQRGMRGGLRLAVRRRVVPPLSLWKSTPTLKQSCDRTSQSSQFTQTSETLPASQESLTSSQWDFPAQAQVTQEVERDSSTQHHLFGEKDLDVLLKFNPSSVLWNNLKGLSDEDFELFLGDLVWQDIVSRLKQSRRESLGRVIKGSDYLSFPTLTSNESSTSRPAGQTKCEKWFKDKGLIQSGYQLSAQAMALIMGFPPNWFDCLSPVEPQEESEQGISQEEPLHHHKQPSPSAESSTSTQLLGGDENSPLQKDKSLSPKQELSIPCLVKQPKQPEVKGVIKKDLGDCPKGSGRANRFLVEIEGQEISVSKLFVYPDFEQCSSKKCKTAPRTGKKVSDTSDKCSSKTNPPSKKSSSKTRRKKGEGSGAIFYRTVTRNGRDYQQAYYHWRIDGQQRSKYIPKKLLDKVQEAESRKLPVADILNLLGEKQKCSSKSFDICEAVSFRTFSAEVDEKVLNRSDKCSSKIERGSVPNLVRHTQVSFESPSKNQRKRGEGSGSIHCKPIKRGNKEYLQYWYHYEFWRDGARLTKKSKYIRGKMRSQIEKMNNEKVPVEEILKVLKNRSLRQKC